MANHHGGMPKNHGGMANNHSGMANHHGGMANNHGMMDHHTGIDYVTHPLITHMNHQMNDHGHVFDHMPSHNDHVNDHNAHNNHIINQHDDLHNDHHNDHSSHHNGINIFDVTIDFGNASSPQLCTLCGLERTMAISFPILIVVMNILTILVLTKTKSFRNVHGYFLLSLAFADLFMGPVASLAIFPLFFNYWPYGLYVCGIAAYIGEVVMKVSLCMLNCLSIERFIAICYPFYYGRVVTKKNTFLTIGFCWIICNLIYFVAIATGVICFTYESDKATCTVTYFMHPTYVVVLIMTFMLPSLFIVTITTSKSVLEIYRSYKLSASCPQSVNDVGKKAHSRNNIRIMKTLVVMLIMFYVAWVPYIVLHIYAVFSGNTWELEHNFEFYSYWLAVSNSFFNPFIYFGLNKKFRRAVIAGVFNLFGAERSLDTGSQEASSAVLIKTISYEMSNTKQIQ